MRTPTFTLTVLFVALVLTVGIAQSPASLSGQVSDEKGQPMHGVDGGTAERSRELAAGLVPVANDPEPTCLIRSPDRH